MSSRRIRIYEYEGKKLAQLMLNGAPYQIDCDGPLADLAPGEYDPENNMKRVDHEEGDGSQT